MTEEVRGAIEVLKKAFKEDPGLARAWHEVISGCCEASMEGSGGAINPDEAASRVMVTLFSVRGYQK